MDIRELGKIQYRSRESIGTYVTSVTGVIDESLDRYREGLGKDGYLLYSEREVAGNRFYIFKRDGDALFLSYFPYTSEARVIEEKNSTIFSYSDEKNEDSVSASITQVDLKDFAMSYAIRLSDGRFILIDIGSFDEDVDSLFEVLTERADGREIRIAAWILTHPHLDHYHGVVPFLKKYGDKLTVEKFIFNFPACEEGDLELIPELGGRFDDYHKIPELCNYLDERNVPVYRPHTGMVLEVGGAKIEILNSPDDNMAPPVQNINNISLVFTIAYKGQKLFFGGDYQFYIRPFTEIWGDYIKSDIMQVTHHGFHGGTKKLIELCNVHTYLMPSFEDDVFQKIDCKYDFNYLSWVRPETRDYYTGATGHMTLSIPHTPRPNGRKILDDLLIKYEVSEDNIVHRF